MGNPQVTGEGPPGETSMLWILLKVCGLGAVSIALGWVIALAVRPLL